MSSSFGGPLCHATVRADDNILLSPNQIKRTLYTLGGGSDGGDVYSGVVIGSGGVLYGTTFSGGSANAGTVFSLTPPASPGGAWTETVLHEFIGEKDGDEPIGPVVIGKSGVLYGTTFGVGGASSWGTVFSLRP